MLRLLKAKEDSGKSFDQIAEGLGVTNAYAVQLFLNQAQLKTRRYASIRNLSHTSQYTPDSNVLSMYDLTGAAAVLRSWRSWCRM